MKKYLLLLLALPFIISSCTKTVITNDNSYPVSGRWILAYAEKQDAFGRKSMYTGYEDGVFYFYDNGQATYDDGYDFMKGDWLWNYHSSSRGRFSLYLYDSYTGRTLNWDFDESWFNGRNQFTAVYSTSNADYYYTFERY
jgi:hypothetical protein